MDYLHFNPVKHGWAKKVIDWPYSSFHHYLQRDLYSADWAGGDCENIDMGEI
jgi:REP-associated tyrosine transposase